MLAGKAMSAIECRLAEDGLALTRVDWRLNDPAFPQDMQGNTATIAGATVYLRVRVESGGICTFLYSTDGHTFTELGEPVKAINAMWIGAKVGLFANFAAGAMATGHADIDWFRFSP